MGWTQLKALYDAKPEYHQDQATWTDAAVAADMNAKRNPGEMRLTPLGLVLALGEADSRAVINAFRQMAAGDVLIDEMLLMFRSNGIDWAHPTTHQMVQAAHGNTLISTAVRDKVLALGANEKSDAEAAGLGVIREGDIQGLRRFISA